MMKNFLFLTLLLMSTGLILAQNTVHIQHISDGIVFDGRPDEPEWNSHAPFEFYMHTPIYGGTPSEESDVRMAFDDDFLYLGASLFYEDISKMAASGKKRDYDQPSCDWFGIHLDTYYDKQNALLFYTNPNGVRFDAAVKGDFQYFDNDVNFSWNTYWEVKTDRDENGWYTEMKIPLSSLRFENAGGETKMGLTLVRFMPYNNEALNWPDISPDYSQATWKPSLSGTVVFDNLKSKKPFYISPYLLAGTRQETKLNVDETGYMRINDPQYEAGLDVKFGLTNNITMDVTLNTDFAQVEVDEQQINLTRYSLFLPEKRVFFQEKADVFSFSLGGPNNLFYSRRIGLNDGEPVRILGGVRMSGRANGWDIGVLDMQTGKSSELPSENFGVIRLKRTVFNSSSYIGGMITSRIGVDGKYNFAYGLDGLINVVGDEYINIRLAQTTDSGIDSKPFSKHPSRIQASWERRREKGFGYDVTLSYSGKEFNPGMGFEMRDSYSGGFFLFHYGWFAKESSFIRKQKIYSMLFTFRSLETNQLDSNTIKSGWSFEGKNGMTGDISYNYSIEILTDTLEFNDNTCISPGDYHYHYLSTEFMLPPNSPVRATIMTEAGSFYDGWKVSATIMPTMSITPSIDLGGTYRLDYIDIPDRNMRFVNHIAGVRALLTFTTKLSLAGFVQYNTDSESVVSNVRFRYNPREGVDFYLVYNEGLNSNPYRHTPYLPVSDSRTVMAKFTYTWGL